MARPRLDNPATVTISASFTPSEREALEAALANTKVSRSSLIRLAVSRYLSELVAV